MKYIDILIITKNRACQLDLLLRSIRDKFKNVGKVNILYTYSNELFEQGYNKLFSNLSKYNLNISLFKETNFEINIKDILINHIGEVYLGICDDDLFIKEVSYSDIVGMIELLKDNNLSSISLKNGLNTIGNYPNFILPQPNFIECGEFFKWKWREHRPDIDWGYPTCVNTHIYLKSYFLSLVNSFSFDGPTNLEGGLNQNRAKFRDYMAVFKEQKILNIPVNRLQTLSPNPFGIKYFYPVEELNSRFLQGEVISTKNIYNYPAKMGNEEVEFIYETE